MTTSGDLARLHGLIERSRQLKEQATRLLTAASKLDESIQDELAMIRETETPHLSRRGPDLFGLLSNASSADKTVVWKTQKTTL